MKHNILTGPDFEIAFGAVFVALGSLFLACGVVAQTSNEGCLDCHELEPAVYTESVHGDLECLDCHAGADDRSHRRGLDPVDCSGCHRRVTRAIAAGAHGGVGNGHIEGMTLPDCASCHGDSHAIEPGSTPTSPVHPNQQAQTCAECHGQLSAGTTGVRTVRPVEAYLASVHAAAAADGRGGATCNDCHDAHGARPATDPASAVHRSNVPETCGKCHANITALYQDSIHGLAAAAGVHDSPICTDCHGEHRLLAVDDLDSPVFATNIPTVVCGPCHANLRLTEKYGMTGGQVPAYADSYHGLASRGGVKKVANCASCHGVHNILPSHDPRSLIHVDNLSATCGKCHEGAGERFGIDPVHVLASDKANIVAYWIRAIYIPLIWIVVVGMLLHNLIDLVRKTRDHEPRLRRAPAGLRIKQRMSGPFRIAHATAALSFVILVISGFALKYPESAWSWPFSPFSHEGVVRGWVHRGAAIGLLAALGFHLVHVIVSQRARQQIAAFLPRMADLTEARDRIGYNLGLRSDPPAPVRVGYVEKLEYWAALWGTLITAISGFFLWFETFTLANLPGWVPEAATALHLYEAILAALSILVWHFYFVLFDPVVYPLDTAWLTGKPPFERAKERGEVVAEDATDQSPK